MSELNRDIIAFQKTIGTPEAESAVIKFADTVLNRLEADGTIKAINNTREVLKKLTVSIGKAGSGDVEGRAMTNATKNVIKELDGLINLGSVTL